MKKLRTIKNWGRVMATLALMATTARAMNGAVSTRHVETIVELVSNPFPVVPAPSVQGYVLVTGKVECDNGASIVLRLGAEPETPGLTLVFHAGGAQLVADGEAPEDVADTMGNGAFDFRLSIRNLAQPVRNCRLEIRTSGNAFETVAQMPWPTPQLASQEPLAWLVAGVATAGLAGVCQISHFAMGYVVPGSLFMVR